jgi:Zn-dependent M28 family amino/carboxypeptidase
MKNILFIFWVLPSLTSVTFEDTKLEGIKTNLITTVKYLSEDIGQRSYLDIKKLNRVADYIEEKFRSYGCAVRRQAFTYNGKTYYNLIAEVKGTGISKDGILVIGAHYDTVIGTPGADDNASGVAVLLEISRLTALNPIQRTVHFVAFGLEEPPVFRTKKMGSYIYAKSLKDEGIKVYGMISLEMVGYYCDLKDCQSYPFPGFKWFYPDRGDFIAFVGNIASRSFTKRIKNSFKSASSLSVESLNTISFVPGVDFSDHLNFWKFGYPAFMITDTAFYRNPNYHGLGDTAETIDYKRMAELVIGLYRTLGDMEKGE